MNERVLHSSPDQMIKNTTQDKSFCSSVFKFGVCNNFPTLETVVGNCCIQVIFIYIVQNGVDCI